jgi:SAM-dependent methyltransferase
MAVTFLSDPEHFVVKEQLYLKIRDRESRVLSDAALQNLPQKAPIHALEKEWRWRFRSFKRLNHHLKSHFSGPVHVLDLGCGNGWMSHQLALNPDWQVTAVDVNRYELEQGSRVFNRPNLRFVFADVLSDGERLGVHSFDVIVLSASAQYFPDLALLLQRLFLLLKPGGEIHITDTHFYTDHRLQQAARARTQTYFNALDVPEMTPYYHHHLWQTVVALGGKNQNSGVLTSILQKMGWLAPFPWVVFARK